MSINQDGFKLLKKCLRYYKTDGQDNSTLIKPVNSIPNKAIYKLEIFKPEL